jgi:hypothetical protein
MQQPIAARVLALWTCPGQSPLIRWSSRLLLSCVGSVVASFVAPVLASGAPDSNFALALVVHVATAALLIVVVAAKVTMAISLMMVMGHALRPLVVMSAHAVSEWKQV